MFDFVSPFDVFEKPKPKAQQQQQQPQPDKKDAPAPIPVPAANGRSTITPPVSSPVALPQTKATPPPPTQSSKPTQAAQAQLGIKNEPRPRQPSASGQGPDGKKDLGLPWLTSKTVEKGAQGRG